MAVTRGGDEQTSGVGLLLPMQEEMQIGQLQSLLPAATPQTTTAADFQAIALQQLGLTPATDGTAQSSASSLIALLSDDDSSGDSTSSSSSLTSLLGGQDDDASTTQSTDQLQSPPDSPSALLLQAQLGL